MEKAIKKFLKSNDYEFKCTQELSTNEVRQLYELYIQNKEPTTIMVGLHGYFAIYYNIKGQYDKMIECNKIQLCNRNKDIGAIRNLIVYIKSTNNITLANELETYFKNKNLEKISEKFKSLSENLTNPKLLKTIPIIQPNTNNVQTNAINNFSSQIQNAIKKYLDGTDLAEIYNMYDKCNTDDEKKQYLCEVALVKNFVQTSAMFDDIFKLTFDDNVPMCIKLTKSIFNGCTTNVNKTQFDFGSLQNAITLFNANGDHNELYKIYDNFVDNNLKKLYLIKVIPLKDFKPTNNMVNDVLKFDFDVNAPIQIKLLKSVFTGCTL